MICQSQLMTEFRIPDRPIISQFNFSQSISQKYEIYLQECSNCEFMRLRHEIPDEAFYSRYSTPSSWKLIPHQDLLLEKAKSLVHKLDNTVVEIGCNDGFLLNVLHSQGFTSLIGIEPSWKSFEQKHKNQKIDVIASYFDRITALKLIKNGPIDLIISRHVLEHVWDLDSFLTNLKLICSSRTSILIEVPDSQTFVAGKDLSFWEEHRNYFTTANLIQLFSKYGFEMMSLQNVVYSGIAQLVTFGVQTQNTNLREGDAQRRERVQNRKSILTKIEAARDEFMHIVQSQQNIGGRIFLFGAGSRSLSFLWTIGSEAVNAIDFFVDSNEMKVGKTLPGTDRLVLATEFLKSCRKEDLVLLGVSFEDEDRASNLIPVGVKYLSLNWPSKFHFSNQ